MRATNGRDKRIRERESTVLAIARKENSMRGKREFPRIIIAGRSNPASAVKLYDPLVKGVLQAGDT